MAPAGRAAPTVVALDGHGVCPLHDGKPLHLCVRPNHQLRRHSRGVRVFPNAQHREAARTSERTPNPMRSLLGVGRSVYTSRAETPPSLRRSLAPGARSLCVRLCAPVRPWTGWISRLLPGPCSYVVPTVPCGTMWGKPGPFRPPQTRALRSAAQKRKAWAAVPPTHVRRRHRVATLPRLPGQPLASLQGPSGQKRGQV